MKVVKIILSLGGVLLLVFVGLSVFFSLVYSPEYICRCLLRGVLRVEQDQAEARPIRVGAMRFQFASGPLEDERQVRKLLEAVFGTNDLETFLTSYRTAAFLVIQDDKLLYEHYFNGYERNSLVQSHSVTKSFVSALIGIAISEGKVQSIEDPITKYLPELQNRDPRFAKIRIRHLLTMSSGVKFDNYFFFTSDNSLSGAYPDLRYGALHFPEIDDEPGQHFLYNDYNPQLLGLVLERVTGTSISNYLEKSIWQPIGMEYDGSWVLDSKQYGFEKMQGGLNARAIDFAKFGRLYLSNGAWNGRRILPESWVVESTREDTALGGSDYYGNSVDSSNGLYYKYMWWGIGRENGSSDYYAMGNYGQMIYISPSKNLIIVRFGEPGAEESDFSRWYEGAYEFADSTTLSPSKNVRESNPTIPIWATGNPASRCLVRPRRPGNPVLRRQFCACRPGVVL